MGWVRGNMHSQHDLQVEEADISALQASLPMPPKVEDCSSATGWGEGPRSLSTQYPPTPKVRGLVPRR